MYKMSSNEHSFIRNSALYEDYRPDPTGKLPTADERARERKLRTDTRFAAPKMSERSRSRSRTRSRTRSHSPDVHDELHTNIDELLRIEGLFNNGDDDKRTFNRLFSSLIYHNQDAKDNYNAINNGILYVLDKKKKQSSLKTVTPAKLYDEIMDAPVVRRAKGGKRTGPRSQKRPTARRHVRRGSYKAHKARKARTTRRK